MQFNPHAELEIHVDACRIGIGRGVKAAHKQWRSSKAHCLFSKALDETKQRVYDVTELEVFGLVRAVQLWRHYLNDKPFDIHTVHAAFEWLKRAKNVGGRVGRWSIVIFSVNARINHVQEKNNVRADVLSRNPVGSPLSESKESGEVYDMPSEAHVLEKDKNAAKT